MLFFEKFLSFFVLALVSGYAIANCLQFSFIQRRVTGYGVGINKLVIDLPLAVALIVEHTSERCETDITAPTRNPGIDRT